jgi:dephospho-CoA kinase
MIKVGLTGNYYSGQYEIGKLFEELDVPVFDADLILKYLINFSSKHIEKIRSELGENSYHMGLLKVNKFVDNRSWNKLIDIVEFDIVKAYEKFRLQHKDEFYTIFKYSYLFERKLNESMDLNISCYRPKYYRRNDMQTLTYMDSVSINKLLENEMDELFKNRKSDFVIDNYNTGLNADSYIIIGLENKVKNTHKSIMKKKPQDDYSILRRNFDSSYLD